MKTNSKLVRLGTICTVVSGTTPDTNNASYWNGDLPWITPAEIEETSYVVCQTARCITKQAVNKKSLNLLPKGTVLLSSRAPIGKVAIAGIDMYCNQGFKNLICSPKIYNEYLYFFLKAKTEYLKSLGRGATFKEISKSIVENILIPLPDIKTQKRIAERLDKVQELIALQKEQLKKLDELIKSRFIDLFGDPITNPKCWPLKRMSDLFKITSGGTPSRKHSEYFENGNIPWVKTGDLNTPYLTNTDEYITELGVQESSAKIFPKGTVLLAMYGATIGAVSILNIEAATNQACAAFLPIDSILPIYLYSFLFLQKKHFVSLGVGGAQPNISGEILKREKILCPPLKLQTQFADFVTKIESQKGLLTTRLSHLETLYKSLMQEYFG